MLTALDESLHHQAPLTFDHVHSTDHRFYDRQLMGGFRPDGEVAFLAGITTFKNMNVIEGFVMVQARSSRQYNVRLTKQLRPMPESDARIGPLALTIVEPFKELRYVLARGDYPMPCPIYHSGPLRFAMAMQQVCATLILMAKFDARESLTLVERHRVTHAHWVPTMLVRLLKLPAEERTRYDLSSVRIVIHGAAPCAPDVKRAMIDWVGPILEESYGGTEGNGLTMITSAEWLAHPGSVGRPFLGAIHILDDDGRELPPGEIGTVWFSGGPSFAYHNNPAKTEAAYDAAGRSTLGDIGYVDTGNYLYLTDRKDNMVISGGVNVFPQEAENRLIGHDRVADAAVFGVPDEDLGEVLHAVVQPLAMAEAGPELEQALIAWCRAGMATIKCPRTIGFSAALPRHDTGKIYTQLLKQAWLAERA